MAGVIGSLVLVSLAKEVTAPHMVGGTQYEQGLSGTTESTQDIDLESFCDSEDGDGAMIDGVAHS